MPPVSKPTTTKPAAAAKPPAPPKKPPTATTPAAPQPAPKPGPAPVLKTGGLFAKLGDKLTKAHQNHVKDETKISGGGELPGGINGIAQLIDCKFDVHKDGDNKGKYFFYAAGTVKQPTTFKDSEGNFSYVEGLRTSITEPIYDTLSRTRKNVDEHIGWIYNELAKLGVERATLNPQTLEAVAAALKKAKPHFRFHTFKGEKAKTGQYKDKEPRVTHMWDGLVEFEDTVDPAAATEDAGEVVDPTPAEEPAVDPGEVDQSDLDSLVVRAPKEPGVQATLGDMAVAAGHTLEAVAATNTWEEVAELIRNPVTAEGAEEGSTEGESTGEESSEGTGEEESVEEVVEEVKADPKAGDMFKFAPLDPKDATKKKRLKALQVQVVTSDPKLKVVSIKNMTDGKTVYKNVKWDMLEAV